MMLIFRPNTFDQAIYQEIVEKNEYHLPERFQATDLILDIGAHAGYFAHAALERGAAKVTSVEANRENYDIAIKNLATSIEAGKSEVHFGAAWRSDENDQVLYHTGYVKSEATGLTNTGKGEVTFEKTGEPLPKIPFDSLVDKLTAHGKYSIRLLKLDCEGSEWPILLTSERLDLIQEICGEYHETGGAYDQRRAKASVGGYWAFTEPLLIDFLTSKGFEVKAHRHRDRITRRWQPFGVFFAKRKG